VGTLVEKIEKQVDPWPYNTMSTHVSKEHLETYVEGFNRAKKQAANLAKEADELMEEMVELLQSCNFDNNTDMREADQLTKKFQEWKERTK